MESEKEPSKSSDEKKGIEVKRTVGLLSGIAFIVGSIIGSGIFITPGGVLERSGSVGLSLVMWAACGLLSILGALAYAELGTLIPLSGGEYVYFMDGLSSLHPFWGPLPAFLYSWISALLLNPTSGAATCLGCASYTVFPILDALGYCLEESTEQSLLKITAILYVGLTIALNSYSVEWTLAVNNMMTVTKLGAIAIIVGCGVYQLCSDWVGNTQYLNEGFEGSTTDIGVIAMAFYSGLWSFYGWNALNYITEEVKDPSRNLPRAIIIGITLVTGCYLVVNVAYLTVLSPEEIISSSAVAMDIGNALLGPVAFIIPLAVAMSTFGMVLAGFFQNARMIFSSAREGHLISVFSYLHVESRTPWPALFFTGLMSVLMILAQDLAGLIDFFSFIVWIFYTLSMILILILRKTRPDAPRPYRVPLVIPIIVIVFGCFLVVAPIISDPRWEYLYVLVALFVGFLVYIPFVYYKYSFRFMDHVTRFIQKVLYVGPPTKPMID